MTVKEGRYKGKIRPFVVFSEKEDVEIEKFIVDLRASKGRKIAKNEFIAAAALYCARKRINPMV